MESKGLGNSNTQLPEIGFGTWNYAGGPGPLHAVIEQGPCLIDTAEAYGTEPVVGEAIRGMRQRVFLATKARPRYFRRSDLIAAAEQSLLRLGTDYIDLYQLHWPNYTVPIEETMRGMADLVDAGKVRFIGVSNFSVRGLQKAQAALPEYSIVANQVQYSLIERTIERQLLTYCQKHAITILAFSPLGSGLSRIHEMDPERVLAQVASLVGKTEAQVALNWVIGKKSVIAITKASSPERVTENNGGSGWSLPEDAIDLLNKKIRFRQRGTIESALRRAGRMSFQLMGKDL